MASMGLNDVNLKLKCRNDASAEETSEIQDLQTNACSMTPNSELDETAHPRRFKNL